MKSFFDYQAQAILSASERTGIGAKLLPKEREFLYKMGKLREKGQRPSEAQMRWLSSIMDKLVAMEESSDSSYALPTDGEIRRHLSIRMAWHLNGWNGMVCSRPDANAYCVGERSLLSRRLRERRKLDKEVPLAGCSLSEAISSGYTPPCFWSINAMGGEGVTIEHDNPAAPNFPKIPESLPVNSVFTWPFKLSFVKDEAAAANFGKYFPEEIFEARINRFASRIEPRSSIAFLYANYDNPVSGDDRFFLVIGCAFVKDLAMPGRFSPPEQDLFAVRRRPKQQNFPTLNWAMRVSLDLPENGVILPYHDYLDEGVQPKAGLEELLTEMRVVIDEPELRSAFQYVAMDIDDDRCIYLLSKIRKSIVTVASHGIARGFDSDKALSIIDDMLELSWGGRGLFPGFQSLARALTGRKPIERDFDSIIRAAREANPENPSETLRSWVEGSSEPIGPEKQKLIRSLREISSSCRDNDLDTQDFLKLCMLGLSDTQFARLKGGKGGVTLLEAARNPYALFESYEPGKTVEDPHSGDEIDGPIGLFKIDEAFFPDTRYLERALGLHDMKAGDPRRIRALVRAYLLSLEGKGHCYSSSRHVDAWVRAFPLFYRSEDTYDVGEAITKPEVSVLNFYSEKLYTEVVSDERYYWLRDIRDAEQVVSELVRNLVSLPDRVDDHYDVESHIIKSIEKMRVKTGNRFDAESFREERSSLFEMLLRKRLCVITGGPGTGKSHEVLWLLNQLKTHKERFLVLAPTGKAAMRLMNDRSSGETIFAKTIDKFLSEQEGQGKFSVGTIIVDEVSMVDLPKLKSLVDAIDFESSSFKRLILVGDRHQLPPIGFGKPFTDIIEQCESVATDNIAELTVNCRQEDDGAAMECASLFGPGSKSREQIIDHLVRGGKFGNGLDIRGWDKREDLSCLMRRTVNDVSKELFPDAPASSEARKLDAILGLDEARETVEKDGIDRFQLLSPYRTGFAGTIAVNLDMQESYRSDDEFAGRGNDDIAKIGDKIVVTKNVYKHGGLVFANGMTGVIDRRKRIHLPDNDTPIAIGEIGKESVEPAYDITVHKGQGSGFDYVGVIIPVRKYLLSRELIYTAFSRSRKKLFLMLERMGDAKEESEFWDELSRRSSVSERRTALFRSPQADYSYTPAKGVRVKSRVEYIIWKKLDEQRSQTGDFSFEYEAVLDVGKRYLIHPDFTIKTRGGDVIYWEHLGKLKDPAYRRSWFLRRDDYKAKGLFSQVVTTDEIGGISDDSIARVIDAILDGVGGQANEYSGRHFSLAAE
jgi:exodeoxyribonuclease V alpha subunit